MGDHKSERVNHEVQRELAGIVRALKDPRISAMASIVRVSVTNDLRYAKAYVSVLGGQKELADTVKGLNSAAGFVRRELGSRLRMRYVPEVQFVPDTSIAYGAHIQKLLTDIDSRTEEQEVDGEL